MTGAEALAEVKRLAAKGYVVFRSHARARMDERGAIVADVVNALVTATSASWQPDRSTWKVTGGVDLDRNDLTVAVDIQADVVVVTIF